MCNVNIVPAATPTDSEVVVTIATPTDSGASYNDDYYTTDDMFVLHFAFILLVVALLVKYLTRKMYINLLGGRKGE